MRRDTACRSMYSDMSKRCNSIPCSTRAGARPRSFRHLSDLRKKGPDRLCGLQDPSALCGSPTPALRWPVPGPNTTAFRSRSRFLSAARSSCDTRPRDACNLGDDLLDLVLPTTFFCLDLGRIFCAAPCLVDDIDRLVGQVPVVDVAGGEFRGAGERIAAVLDAVVRLEARFQAAQDRNRLLDRGLGHVDLLEAPRQRVILFEYTAYSL